jgi:hypothetical protein
MTARNLRMREPDPRTDDVATLEAAFVVLERYGYTPTAKHLKAIAENIRGNAAKEKG